MNVASCETSFLTEVKVPNLMIEKIEHKYIDRYVMVNN